MSCDDDMTPAQHRSRVLRTLSPLLLLLAACASDGYDSVGQMRSDGIRPERPVPSGVTEMREDMSEMRQDTLARLDEFMGGAPSDAGYWYTPIFDTIDLAMSLVRLF